MTDQVIPFGTAEPYLLFDRLFAGRGFMRQNDGSALLKANTAYLLRAQFIINPEPSALRNAIGLYNRNTDSFLPNSVYDITRGLQVYEYPVLFDEDTYVQLRMQTQNSALTLLSGISFIEIKEV